MGRHISSGSETKADNFTAFLKPPNFEARSSNCVEKGNKHLRNLVGSHKCGGNGAWYWECRDICEKQDDMVGRDLDNGGRWRTNLLLEKVPMYLY
jgi:hypothetical protein